MVNRYTYFIICLILIPSFCLGGMLINPYQFGGGGGAACTTTTLRPNGDYSANWTPSTGTDHYALVDESTADDADYVATNTAYAQEFFDFEDLPACTGTIASVEFHFRGKTTVVDVNASVKVEVNDAVDGDWIQLSTTFSNYSHTMTTNPDGGGSWTSSSVNAANMGIISNSLGGRTLTISQVWLVVNYE